MQPDMSVQTLHMDNALLLFFLKIIFHNIGNPRYESIVATHIGICGNLFCICGNLFFFIYVCIRYRQINHHGNELAVNESSKNRNNFTYDSSQRHDYKDEEVKRKHF